MNSKQECSSLKMILKKECESCLIKIFNSESKMISISDLLKKDRYKENFLAKCIKFHKSNLLKIILEYGSDDFIKTIYDKNTNGVNSIFVSLNYSKHFESKLKCFDLLLYSSKIIIDNTQTFYGNDYILNYIVENILDSERVLKYLKYLIEERNLSPLSIGRYDRQLLHNFFRSLSSKQELDLSINDDTTYLLFLFIMELFNSRCECQDIIYKVDSFGSSILQMCLHLSNAEKYLSVLIQKYYNNEHINEYFRGQFSLGHAPIHYVVFNCSVDYLRLLLDCPSIDITLKSEHTMQNSLHILCDLDVENDASSLSSNTYRNLKNVMKCIKLLLEKSKTSIIDEIDSQGYTPLDYADQNNSKKIYTYLLGKGAATNHHFPTPRLFERYQDVLEKLSENRVVVDDQGVGNSNVVDHISTPNVVDHISTPNVVEMWWYYNKHYSETGGIYANIDDAISHLSQEWRFINDRTIPDLKEILLGNKKKFCLSKEIEIEKLSEGHFEIFQAKLVKIKLYIANSGSFFSKYTKRSVHILRKPYSGIAFTSESDIYKVAVCYAFSKRYDYRYRWSENQDFHNRKMTTCDKMWMKEVLGNDYSENMFDENRMFHPEIYLKGRFNKEFLLRDIWEKLYQARVEEDEWARKNHIEHVEQFKIHI